MDELYSEPIDETPPVNEPEPPAETYDDSSAKTVIFEELTLAQALAYLFWRPARTASLFWQVLTRDPEQRPRPRYELPVESDEPPSPNGDQAAEPDVLAYPIMVEPLAQPEPAAASPARIGWIILLALAILVAGIGGTVLHNAGIDPKMHEPGETHNAKAILGWMGMLLAALAAIRWVQQRGTARRRGEPVESPVWIVVILIALFVGMFGIAGFWGSTVLVGFAGVVSLFLLVGDATLEEIRPSVMQTVALPAQTGRGFWLWFQEHVYQLMLIPPALLTSMLAYTANVERDLPGNVVDVVLTPTGLIAWVVSIILWILILAVDVRRLPAKFQSRPSWLRSVRFSWTFLVLLTIVALGAYFRLHDLDSTPPEMTSDHIEKLLDSLRVGEGYYGIFFPNNGGREGFQMYMVAFIAEVLGVGYNFNALKLATIFEGLITLPALWWMARQIFGDETEQRRALGNWVGLALAGLVAVSSWHVMLSRLGLRIVLTPLTTALVLGFLARAVRKNRMQDYVALGFTLGAGIYFYQANRMLPIVVVVGIGLVLLARIRIPKDALQLAGEVLGFAAVALTPILVYWYVGDMLRQSDYTNTREAGERLGSFLPLVIMLWFSLLVLVVRARQSDGVLQYGGGLLAVVVVALALYIPMYHYTEIYPEYFWNRTWGRMFGEDAFHRPDPETGALLPYEPGLREQLERFWEERDVFNQNVQDVLKMFHWEGDGAWISNPHSRPALDGITGGLLLLGVVMWGARLLRRPSPVNWLVPLAGLVMLLPSAMTLAYVIENPSFTRASGSIPSVYLLAALSLGAFCWRLSQLQLDMKRIPVFRVIALLVLAGILAVIIRPNWDNFFTAYRLSYSQSWKPYREISKPLREFAQGEGSYGNAFMVAYPHWLDHRILGTMAGDIRWSNGLLQAEDLLTRIENNEGTPYAYDPDRPLFVMYNVADTDTAVYLETTYPGGTSELYTYSFETDTGSEQGSFYIYRLDLETIAG